VNTSAATSAVFVSDRTFSTPSSFPELVRQSVDLLEAARLQHVGRVGREHADDAHVVAANVERDLVVVRDRCRSPLGENRVERALRSDLSRRKSEPHRDREVGREHEVWVLASQRAKRRMGSAHHSGPCTPSETVADRCYESPVADGPAVSVLLPARNAAGDVAGVSTEPPAAAERAWECIVVDDGSTRRPLEPSPPRRQSAIRASGSSRYRTAAIVAALETGLAECRAPLVARYGRRRRDAPRDRLAAERAALDADPGLAVRPAATSASFPRRAMTDGLRDYERWLAEPPRRDRRPRRRARRVARSRIQL